MFDKLKMAANWCVLSFLFAAKLVIESDNFGRVRIRGALTNYYLCIKRNATLIGRKVALIAYGYFIILCAQCLQNAVYSLLIGRIMCMGIRQICIRSGPGETVFSGKFRFSGKKLRSCILGVSFYQGEFWIEKHCNQLTATWKNYLVLRCPDVWIWLTHCQYSPRMGKFPVDRTKESQTDFLNMSKRVWPPELPNYLLCKLYAIDASVIRFRDNKRLVSRSVQIYSNELAFLGRSFQQHN